VEAYKSGDLCDTYKGLLDGKLVLVKVSTDNADLVKNEAATLRKLYTKEDIKSFKKYLPNLIDSIKVNGKLANVFEFDQGSYTLEEVIAKYPNGLDGRTVAWMWRRMLEAVSWAHSSKQVHGCIIPSNILIQPATRGLILLDWCYSVPMGSTAKAYVESSKDFFPPELFKKLPLDGGADLYMIAKCVQALFNGVSPHKGWPWEAPKLMTGVADGCLLASPRNRSVDTWAVYDTLQKNLEKIYGKPKFIPFEM
jgi:serine/threonine protein kinase